jgi:hypothetical protein
VPLAHLALPEAAALLGSDAFAAKFPGAAKALRDLELLDSRGKWLRTWFEGARAFQATLLVDINLMLAGCGLPVLTMPPAPAPPAAPAAAPRRRARALLRAAPAAPGGEP